MPWVRSRLGEKCPMTGEEVHPRRKWFPKPYPCIKGEVGSYGSVKDCEVCEYLSTHWTGRENTSVRCKYNSSNQQ